VKLKGKEAIALSGRSETWLRRHECAWCGQTLWLALTSGCGAIAERCDPTKKNFGPDAKLKSCPDPELLKS